MHTSNGSASIVVFAARDSVFSSCASNILLLEGKTIFEAHKLSQSSKLPHCSVHRFAVVVSLSLPLLSEVATGNS